MNVGRIVFNSGNSNPVSHFPIPLSPVYLESLSGKFSIENLVGKKFRRREKRGMRKYGEGMERGYRTETRKIVDRTYGNSIVWTDRYRTKNVTPLKEFAEWLRNAKIVKTPTE